MYVKVTWAKKLMPQRAEVLRCRAAMATDMSYWDKKYVTNFVRTSDGMVYIHLREPNIDLKLLRAFEY